MKLSRFILKSFRVKKSPPRKVRTKPPSKSISRIKGPKDPKGLVVQKSELPKQEPQFCLRDFIRPDPRTKSSLEGFLLDQRSTHTQTAYTKDIKRFVKFLLVREQHNGNEPLSRTTVIAYKDWLLSENLQHTTVDRHLATLRSLFEWFVQENIFLKNPAENVRFLNPKRISKTNAFSDIEVQKILKMPNLHSRTGAQHYAVLMVLFYCGLRRSELCGLRTLAIQEERKHWVVRLKGKGNSERLLPLVPAVKNSIDYLLHITGRTLREDGYLFAPIKNNRTSVLSKPLDPSMVFYIVRRYAKLAGIEKTVSPHSCRATAISNARDHQVSDRAIQEFAGWASADMITRYDKRKTSIEDSAAHAINYETPDKTAE